MFSSKSAICPVCKNILGQLVPKEMCLFPCRECQWIYRWDGKGKLMSPIKLDGKKPDTCNCLGCQGRKEQTRLKNLGHE